MPTMNTNFSKCTDQADVPDQPRLTWSFAVTLALIPSRRSARDGVRFPILFLPVTLPQLSYQRKRETNTVLVARAGKCIELTTHMTALGSQRALSSLGLGQPLTVSWCPWTQNSKAEGKDCAARAARTPGLWEPPRAPSPPAGLIPTLRGSPARRQQGRGARTSFRPAGAAAFPYAANLAT